MIRIALLAAALVLLASAAEAQIRGHINSCVVGATPVAFGTFSGRRIDSVGEVTLTCDGNGNGNPFAVSLSQGVSNSFVDRFMLHGLADELAYNLYIDEARTLIWGNGAGETGLVAQTFNFPGEPRDKDFRRLWADTGTASAAARPVRRPDHHHRDVLNRAAARRLVRTDLRHCCERPAPDRHPVRPTSGALRRGHTPTSRIAHSHGRWG